MSFFGLVVGVVAAAGAVNMFTDEQIFGQLDYMTAAAVGIIVTSSIFAFFIPSFVSVSMMAGGLIGCTCYHIYKEF